VKKSEELFKKVITDHGLSKASRLAPPQIAHLKFLEKKYDEAIQLYQAYLKEVPENTVYHSLALMALAAGYEGQGDFEKPSRPFKESFPAPSPPSKSRRPST